MSSGDSITKTIAQPEHRVEKRDRIRPSRQCEENHRIASDADSRQAVSNGPKQSRVRLGGHPRRVVRQCAPNNATVGPEDGASMLTCDCQETTGVRPSVEVLQCLKKFENGSD